MKTITRTILLFTAAELKEADPQAFEKAREKYNDAELDLEWWRTVYDEFLQIAPLMGFSVESDNIQFSGFWSQGDGASFTGSAVFAVDALEKVKSYAPQDTTLHAIAKDCGDYGAQGIRCRIERISSHYCHENTISVEDNVWTLDAEGELQDCTEEAADNVRDTCRALMRWLYGQLEKEHTYRSGEECFLETAAANEWTFTADGEMENE